MTTFQRARSEQERAMRRRAILDVATVMLAEMPVAEISLNELSPRRGLLEWRPVPCDLIGAQWRR